MIISANLINFQNSRFDVCCCVKISTDKLENTDSCLFELNEECWIKDGWLFYLIKEFYAPFLLNKVVRPIVVSF
jgi:hypothetical protein